MRAKPRSIRKRLLLSYLLIVLLPLLGITTGILIIGYSNGRGQALQNLETAAELRELQLSTWKQLIRDQLTGAFNEEYAAERMSVVLELGSRVRYYDFYLKAVRNRLQLLVDQSAPLEALYIIDPSGLIILSTQIEQENRLFPDQEGLLSNRDGFTLRLPFTNQTGAEKPVFASIPIPHANGELLGFLVGRYRTDELVSILKEQDGLEQSSTTVLIDDRYQVIQASAGGSFSVLQPDSEQLPSEFIETALVRKTNGSGIYTNLSGGQVLGIYHWLPDFQAAILVEQNLAEVMWAVLASLTVNLVITLAAITAALAVSLWITRSIADPLAKLSSSAARIAQGDLSGQVSFTGEDEIGVLSHSFNLMTSQLRELIAGLEHRVKERTWELQTANQALQYKALQLETSARISQQVSRILQIDELLKQVVELLQHSFGYYHVLVYLVDKATNQLFLKANTTEIDPMYRQLEIGPGSLNGIVAHISEPILVNDVTLDNRYLPDENLPATRAELVLPLRIGGTLIGTLDVQSEVVEAFSPEDVLVLQSLGDQIAIAIENARLYDQSRELATLEERHRLARELHDSVTQSLYSLSLLSAGWSRTERRISQSAMKENMHRISEIAKQALREMRLLVYELRPPTFEQEGLLGALHHRLKSVETRTGVQIHLDTQGELELPLLVEQALYRIAQEALNNALKHSFARSVRVNIRRENAGVVLEIQDDGQGFDPSKVGPGDGLGLNIMRERADALGGRLEILSAPGKGTTIRALVPFQPQPEALPV